MEDHTGQKSEQSVAERISRLSQMIIQVERLLHYRSCRYSRAHLRVFCRESHTVTILQIL